MRHTGVFSFAAAVTGCLLALASPARALAPGANDSEKKAAPTGETTAPNAEKRAPPAYRAVRIDGVPHLRQKPDFCGEACVAMVLAKLGHRANQDDVFDQSGLDPELGRGCYTRDLWRALQRIGFDAGVVWYRVSVEDAGTQLESHFRALHADLMAGIPSIVCMRYDDNPETTEHFRLVLGYDPTTDEVLYHEPAVDDGAYRRMGREQLLDLWPMKYDPARWTLIRFRMQADVLRSIHAEAGFTNADYAQQVMRVKQMASEDFTVVIQRPFIVAGDEPAETVRKRATGTIRWATERLKRSYFAEDPNDILTIWLFKDKESYGKHTAEIFGDWPDTPFGYFSHADKALIMNIDTGSGTLVHEMVHPFIASNFPDCPAWFNEGLASLYEQCGDRGGRIWGYTNWRLNGLQESIRAFREQEAAAEEAASSAEAPASEVALPGPGAAIAASSDAPANAATEEEPPPPPPAVEVPAFRELCSTTTWQFYRRDPGTNYAQARYLCYYLQQRGLLEKFYHQFRKNVQQDPTGYETLKSVLGFRSETEMAGFQTAWEDWVLRLRFP